MHGGGFYLVQKYRVAPRVLPVPLHWFKWEAYTTWLSGFALMVVLYYLSADRYLVDPAVLDLSTGAAIGISIALLAVAWLVYDALCRALEGQELVLAACLLGLTAVAAWGCGELFAARAAYLQVGSMLGTIMAANVFFVIIPAHWALVRAKQTGQEPDPEPGIRAKQRSVHNNYLTLPVLFAMLAGHFPTFYAQSYAWLILIVIMAVGAWIRLFFNLHHAGRNVWAIPISAAAALVVLAFAIEPETGGGGEGGKAVPFTAVQRIVQDRCQLCHASSEAAAGVRLDTPDQISRWADQIRAVAVDSTVMPQGNVTRMTDAERKLLGRWIAQGAKTR